MSRTVCLEAPPGAAAGIALVALHHRRPLPVGHGARAAVGQKIDGDVLGVEQEHIVMRRRQPLHAPLARGDRQSFRHLDPERLDDGAHAVLLSARVDIGRRGALCVPAPPVARTSARSEEIPMAADVTFPAAAAAGFLSFLSPCVLPLVPPYLTFIAGTSIEELTAVGKSRARARRAARLAAVRRRLLHRVRRARRDGERVRQGPARQSGAYCRSPPASPSF